MPGSAAAPIRVALIGYGLAGAVFHAPLIAAVPGLRLASIVTGHRERAARARAAWPEARVLPEPRALWAGARDHELVVVAAPNRFHVPLGLAALEAGLHLVVDKPLAASSTDGRRLASAAVERDLVAAVFHNRRWDGDALTLERLLRAEALGAVLRFESRFERWRPEVDAGRWRERAERKDAGGVLFDLGSHLIDQALWLFGPALRVFAEIGCRRPGAAVDDDVFLSLEHASGVRSHLWAGYVTAQRGPRMRVLGMRAGWVKWGLDPQEAALRAGASPGDPDFAREPPERFGLLGTDGESEPVETEPGRYIAFYEGMELAIRTGARPPVSLDEGIAVLEVIEAAHASAARPAVVELGSAR